MRVLHEGGVVEERGKIGKSCYYKNKGGDTHRGVGGAYHQGHFNRYECGVGVVTLDKEVWNTGGQETAKRFSKKMINHRLNRDF